MVYMYLFHLLMLVISHLLVVPLIASLDYKLLKLSPVSFPYFACLHSLVESDESVLTPDT